MAEVPAAKEKIDAKSPMQNAGTLPETRVRGSHISGTACIEGWSWLSSTTRWGCGHVYDGTASVSLVQRYYSSQLGRFMTPDPYRASAGARHPQSWNRYAYAANDPTNYNDPKGLFICPAEGCGDEGEPEPVPDPQILPPHPVVPPPISWTNVLRKGLQAVVNMAKKALAKPNCAKLFGREPQGDPSADPDYPYPGSDPAGVLQSLVDQGDVDFKDFGNNPAYSVSGVPAKAVMEVGGQLFVNNEWEWTSGRIIINSMNQPGYWSQSMPMQNAITLLHELGHYYADVVGYGGSAIKDDANNTALSQANTALIKKDCF